MLLLGKLNKTRNAAGKQKQASKSEKWDQNDQIYTKTPQIPLHYVHNFMFSWVFHQILLWNEFEAVLKWLIFGYVPTPLLLAPELRSRRFLGGVGFFIRLRLFNWIMFYITLLSREFQLIWQFLKLFLKQNILAVYHDFHCVLVATKLLTAKLHSFYVKGAESEILPPTPQPWLTLHPWSEVSLC